MGNYAKNKGRSSSPGTFFRLPHAVMDSPNFTRLSTGAVKLLLDLGRQYNGRNNGDLCATFSVMKKRGWSSAGSVQNAKDELYHYLLIQITQLGGRNRPTLYGFTWLPIDKIKGNPEVVDTSTASGLWKDFQPKYVKKPRKKINFCTHHMSTCTHQAEQ